MSLQTWQETLITNTGVGPTIAAITIASLLPTDAVLTLPANYFYTGRKLRITAWGQTTTVVTTPGTKTFTVNIGGVAVFATPAMALNIVAGTYNWELSILLNCTAVGSGVLGKIKGTARFSSAAIVGAPLPSAGGSTNLLSPLGAQVDGAGFSTVAAGAVDLLITNTVNSGDILHHYVLESLN